MPCAPPCPLQFNERILAVANSQVSPARGCASIATCSAAPRLCCARSTCPHAAYLLPLQLPDPVPTRADEEFRAQLREAVRRSARGSMGAPDASINGELSAEPSMVLPEVTVVP